MIFWIIHFCLGLILQVLPSTSARSWGTQGKNGLFALNLLSWKTPQNTHGCAGYHLLLHRSPPLRSTLCTSPNTLSVPFICWFQSLSAHFTAAETNLLWRASSIPRVITEWLTTTTRVPAESLGANVRTNCHMGHTDRDIVHMLSSTHTHTCQTHATCVSPDLPVVEPQSRSLDRLTHHTIHRSYRGVLVLRWISGSRKEEGVHVKANKSSSEMHVSG